jgi:hypothetical protein
MDSEFLKLGKRRRNARLQSAKWPWVITRIAVKESQVPGGERTDTLKASYDFGNQTPAPPLR